MQTRHHTDITIVGGGMVGASLALSLRALPWSVALVDPRHPEPGSWSEPEGASDFTPRVSALSPTSEHWLAQLGIWSQLPAHRIGTYYRMQVWDADGSGELDFQPEMAGLNHLGHIVENAVVESTLWDQLTESHDLTLLAGQSVTGALQTAGAADWTLDLDSGDTLQTRLLLIVDGARSPLRQQLGFTTREWDYEQQAVVTTVSHEHSHRQTAYQAFHRDGPLAFLPLALPHCSSIVWSLDTAAADDFLQSDPELQARRLAAGLGQRLGAVTLADRARSFPLRQRHAVRYVQPGAALVGDAAHSIHPLAGQGANLGMKDAAALFEALQWASEQSVELTDPLILRRYQRARQTDNLLAMAGMESFKRLFGSDNPLVHLGRNLGLRGFAATPALMRAAVRQATS